MHDRHREWRALPASHGVATGMAAQTTTGRRAEAWCRAGFEGGGPGRRCSDRSCFRIGWRMRGRRRGCARRSVHRCAGSGAWGATPSLAVEASRSWSCARGKCPEARAYAHGSLPPAIWAMAVGNFRGQIGGPHSLVEVGSTQVRTNHRPRRMLHGHHPVGPDPAALTPRWIEKPKMTARLRDARRSEIDMPGAGAARRTSDFPQTARSRPKTVNCFAPHVHVFRLTHPSKASAWFVPHTHISDCATS